MVFRLHKDDVSMAEVAFVLLKNVTKIFNGSVKAISDLTIMVRKGEFFSLLGPSGCGKTTILRLIAGLESPDSGEIFIGGRKVAGNDTWIEPEKRGVGFVFQDYALFPHMTVFENVAFGIRGVSKNEKRRKVMEMLELVGMSDMADRYPHELSGGQQQRVALARALAPSPKVILLDEPFSNLDPELRLQLRTETKRILKEKGITTILVTHDQEEAFSLSDRVGVVNQGRLEQVGTPEEIYHQPATRFVANFVGGANFVSGKIKEGSVISDIGVFKYDGAMSSTAVDVELMIRPEDVGFTLDPSGDAVVVDAQFLGPKIIYRLRVINDKIIHSIQPSTNLISVGSKVKISIDPERIKVFTKEGVKMPIVLRK